MKPQSSVRYFYQLDIVRAFAALSVFLVHWYGSSFGQDQLPWKGWWRDWGHVPNEAFRYFYPLSFGWVGVPFFFVISGFCIHSGWASGKSFTTGQFYWRRFWRIVPPYWVILSFFVWRSWAVLEQKPGFEGNLLTHVLFFHNVKGEWYFDICPAFWSLAVEVQFYLIYPLLLKWRKYWSMERILMAGLTLAIVGPLVSFLWLKSVGERRIFLQNTPVLWFDWLLGALLAERVASNTLIFRRPARWLAVCGMLLLLSSQYLPLDCFSFTFASICAVVCLEQYLVRRAAPCRAERLLLPLGICSYSFYLLHQRVLASFFFHWPPTNLLSSLLKGALVLALICALSGLSYWILEKQFLRLGVWWGRRLFSPANKMANTA